MFINRFILFFTFLCFICIGLNAEKIEIVKNKIAKAIVVLPEAPDKYEILAANELVYHINKSTGAKLTICKENDIPKDFNVIYLGACKATIEKCPEFKKLGQNCSIIKTLNGKLYIAGKDGPKNWKGNWTYYNRGTLFGVYDFLERQLGVRWLWPGKLGEHIPKHSDVVVGNIGLKLKPKIESSYVIRPLWAKRYKNPDEFTKDENQWLLRQRFAQTTRYITTHIFRNYWKRFYRQHSEYYALLPNGKRGLILEDNPATRNDATFCVSNTDLHKQIVSDWNKHVSPVYMKWVKNVDDTIFVGSNDSPGMCTCSKCRSWDADDKRFKAHPYWGKRITPKFAKRFTVLSPDSLADEKMIPSLSDRYARFFLEIQKLAKEKHPDIKVAGFAYANYKEPPRRVKLNKNIYIGYVPSLLYPLTNERINLCKKEWLGWIKSGATLGFRPNFNRCGHNLPVAYAGKLYDLLKFVYQNGSKHNYFDCLTGQWGIQGPTLYVLGRMNVAPELSLAKILDEYYSAFGCAKNEVKKYFEFLERVNNSITEKDCERKKLGSLMIKECLRNAELIFTDPIMKRARILLEAAKRKALTSTNKVTKERIKFLLQGLKHAELTLEAEKAFKRYSKDKNSSNLKRFTALREKLKDFRGKMHKNVSDIPFLEQQEGRYWGWPKVK